MKTPVTPFRVLALPDSVEVLCLYLLILLTEFSSATVYMNKHCHEYVTNNGDLIKSQDTLYYKPNYDCGMVLNANRKHGDSRILLHINDLNIASDDDCQSSYLHVSPVMRPSPESSSSLRICNKTHSPRYIVSEGSYLTLRMVNLGTDVGRGFSGVFAVIFPTNKPLSCREPNFYKCSNGYCITQDLTCDTVDHCGDGSDENQEYCKEDEVRWMDVGKGPISIVEITFTLLALGIIATVVIVIISHCCSEFARRRKKSGDSIDGRSLMRSDSVTVQQPGVRLPVQRLRSISVDISARNATQEDLHYLQSISTASDDVFVDPDDINVDNKRKLSKHREDINKRIESNVKGIQKNDAETHPKQKEKRKLSTQKSVAFTIGDENDNDDAVTDENAALLKKSKVKRENESKQRQSNYERSVSRSDTESNSEIEVMLKDSEMEDIRAASSLTEDNDHRRPPLLRETHIEIKDEDQQHKTRHLFPLETEI